MENAPTSSSADVEEAPQPQVVFRCSAVHEVPPRRSVVSLELESPKTVPAVLLGGQVPYSPEVRSRAIPRVAAPRIRRTTTARTARSESICTMATIRAGSDFGVMSPKPTVENTVTVK